MATKKVEEIVIKRPNPVKLTITIVGKTDLVLNKMDDVTTRELTDIRKDKAKDIEKPNEWEKIITSIHWLNGKPKEFTEKAFVDALKSNKPCITAHGIQEMLKQAIVRAGIETYSTKLNFNVNVYGVDGSGLIPIDFEEHYLNEMLMSPQKGKPVLVRLNCFKGWSADIELEYLDGKYSADELVNLMELAGFGSGIGSSRNAGFGRFHVENVK